jgi:hypothetical protein
MDDLYALPQVRASSHTRSQPVQTKTAQPHAAARLVVLLALATKTPVSQPKSIQ